MATTLHVQGLDIELDESESYNKVRHRLNKATQVKIDYEEGNLEDDDKFQPYHELSFKTSMGGRISLNHEKVIGVSSDLPKDEGSGDE